MREIWVGTGADTTKETEIITCEYYILVHEMDTDFGWESYGIKVTRKETGESVRVADITVNADKMMDLALLLRRNLVTPCTLREVLEELL